LIYIERSEMKSTPEQNSRRLWWSACLVLAVLAAGLAYAVSQRVFHQAPLTTDENSYVFQAQNFAEGRIARPAPVFPKAFAHRMIILDADAGWLSRYPPLHSLWLLPGLWLGDPYLMSALAALLSVLLVGAIARRRLGAGFGSLLAPLLLVLSPYFIFMHATLLSHTSGVLATTLMLWAYLRWRETGSWRDAAIAGGAWGLICLNRTFTALCLCLPLALDALWILWGQRTLARLIGVAVFAASAAAGVGALLVYNALAVGDALTMTYLFYDPSEKLGFGLRHTAGIPIDHTFKNGLIYLRDNVVSLDRWLFGMPWGLVVTAALIAIGWCRRTSLLLVACTLSVWGGYIFFWYPGVRETGPVYYMETLPFVVMAAASGLVRLGASARPGVRGLFVMGLLMVAGNAVRFAQSEGETLASTYGERAELRRIIDAAPARALVFVPRDSHADFLMLNARGLDSEPLVAKPVPGQNMAIVRYFADRPVLRLQRHPKPHLVVHEEKATLNVDVHGSGFHRHTGENATQGDVGVRIGRRSNDAPGPLAFGIYAHAYPGRFACHFDVEVSHALADDVVGATLRIMADGGTRVIAEKDIAGALLAGGVTFALDLKDFDVIEPVVIFTGKADVTLRRVTIKEMH
jgi:hypothetical protein